MGEPGGGPSEQEGAAAEYKPSKMSGRLIGSVLAVLIVTNLITAASIFYGLPQRVEVPATLPACPDNAARDPVYLSCPTEIPPPQRSMKVIGPWAGPEKAAFLPVLEKFKTDTGINYEYITIRQEDLQTILPIQFPAQESPADLIFMPSSFITSWADSGWVANVAGTIPETNYPTGTLDLLKIGTALYGGAYTGKIKPGFWYKKSFFTANGLSVPTTWAEFETLLAAIEPLVPNEAIISGDSVGWPLSDVTEHFLATYGGPNMHRQLTAGTLAWTDTSVRNVFANRLVPTLTPGTVCITSCWSAPRQWDTGVTEWWNGDYGLYFMGSWITGMVDALPGGDSSDMGVFSLPEAPGAAAIVFGPDFYFVPAYADNLAEGKELATFLSTSTAQAIQVSVGGHIATALNVPLSAYPAVDAGIAALMVGKEILYDMDDTIGGTFQTTFWSQLQLLWVSPADLDTVLANIEAVAP